MPDHIDRLIRQLRDFIHEANTSYVSNLWLRTNVSEIYVRKSQKIHDDQMITVLDIANASFKKTHRGKGGMTRFLEAAQQMIPWDGIFIENISDPRHTTWFLARGFFLPPHYNTPLTAGKSDCVMWLKK